MIVEHRHHFNSLYEFIQATEKKHKDKGSPTGYVYFDNPQFIGLTRGEKEYEEILAKGWIPDSGFRFSGDIAYSEGSAIAIEHQEYGFMPDVSRYLSGEQEFMFQMTEQPAPVRQVKVAVQMNCNAGIDASEMMDYNARLIAAVKQLQSQGIEVLLRGFFYNDVDGNELLTIDLVNNGVVNPSIIGTALHTSNFRVTWFRWAYANYGNVGGSRKPDSEIDGYQVLPSVEFAEEVDLEEWMLERL